MTRQRMEIGKSSINSDFSRNWDPEGAPDDPDMAQSRMGFIIEYAGCPVIWASKMQTLIALSSSEAEYIALSTSLRETIPLMELLHEIRDQGFNIKSSKPTVHCKVFKDCFFFRSMAIPIFLMV